jgi:hypothetical protein
LLESILTPSACIMCWDGLCKDGGQQWPFVSFQCSENSAPRISAVDED